MDETIQPSVKLFKAGEELTNDIPKPEPKYSSEEMTEPYSPATLLDHAPIPGFRIKWQDKDNITKYLSEGWIIHEEDGEEQARRLPPTLRDGEQTDSTVQMRELILMKMPEEMAKSRNKYWQKMAGDNVKSVAMDFKRKAKAESQTRKGSRGDGAYGNINISSLEDEEGDNG